MSRLDRIRKDSRKETRRSQRRAYRQARRARRRLEPVARDIRGGAASATEAALDWMSPRVEAAREWASPRVDTARDWAAPRVEVAVEKVRDDVLPKVTDAVTTALAATEPARKEAKVRGAAAVAALRGELEPPKPRRARRRLGRLLMVLGALAAGIAGWTAWNRSKSGRVEPLAPWAAPEPGGPASTSTSDLGTTAVTPTAEDVATGSLATAPTVSETTRGSDAAGASPSEALADAAEEEETDASGRPPTGGPLT